MTAPYDEAHTPDGAPRAHYAELLDGFPEPTATARALTRRARSAGMTFPMDPFPRVLTAAEWSELQAGVAQRMRALEAFVEDVYGAGRVYDAGLVDRADVERSAHFEPAMRDARPRRWISYMGVDVVRTPDGRFRVIEDQVRMPSGVAYAVGLRETLRDLLPVAPPRPDSSPAFEALGRAIRAAAPTDADAPRVVTLSAGPKTPTFWEHERLAGALGAPVVELADLAHRDGRLVAWVDGRAEPVDVVYLRTDEDRFRAPDGSPSAVGSALLGPCANGTLACVNAPGSGVADDKLVHAKVGELMRFYLGQESLLPSVPARRLEPGMPLDELVVKPRGEMGGEDVVIWRDADRETRARLAAAIEREPDAWIGQERVTLSVHPTVCDGRLEPRHVDLRPYAVASEQGVEVLDAALSRVALERGSMIVNAARGGGAKDVWQLDP